MRTCIYLALAVAPAFQSGCGGGPETRPERRDEQRVWESLRAGIEGIQGMPPLPANFKAFLNELDEVGRPSPTSATRARIYMDQAVDDASSGAYDKLRALVVNYGVSKKFSALDANLNFTRAAIRAELEREAPQEGEKP
jgi:hypothetical protein